MKRRLTALFLGLGLVVAFLAATGRVQATLGESEDSIDSDKTAIEATGSSTAVHTGYTVRELRSDAVVLREYVAPSGIIFAIAWNGQIHPNLTPLLGAYAAEYRIALQQTSPEPGSRRLQVQTNRIMVEKWGHMRNLQGRVHVPALIPPGVNLDEIK